ncbi:hypothetical protein [Frigoriglobus tundricola]|uniref:Uncharacterized protein n=1 Tax=Frigoriglobus tundricola TaxID=2774151 RepID=A0A6M5YIK8_9BACT|nr:hypothetical protein [Frigoriglobus tundricola]QJW93096.1 hypothetical protein FTUN_0599 [Frigoriglobus tundricola]
MRAELFSYYATLEPALLDLEVFTRVAAKMRGHRERIWSTEIKSVLVTLVGWARRVPDAVRVERVRRPDGLLVLEDICDAGRRQDRANAAALACAGASDVFAHDELATVQAYRTCFDHLRGIFDAGGA